MIRYKEWAKSHKMDEALGYLGNLVEKLQDEGWVTAGDIVVTKQRNATTGGLAYTAARPMAREEFVR